MILIALMSTLCAAAPDDDGFEFHGYFRLGAGLSEGGDNQALFRAPGARSHYSLGNQPDTVLEFLLSHETTLDPAAAEVPYQGTIVIMTDGYAGHGTTFALNGLSQCYGQLAREGGGTLWAGRRYYDRKYAGLNDHFWLNSGQGSQAGIGLERADVGVGRLSAAAFRLEDRAVPSAEADSEDIGLVNSTALDLRWTALPAPLSGELTLWGSVVWRHPNDALQIEAADGQGAGAWLEIPLPEGQQTLAGIYQRGAAFTQASVNPNPVREDQGYDLEDTWTWEVLSETAFQSSERLVLVALGLIRREHGAGPEALTWYSAGARPTVYLFRPLSASVEGSYDYVINAPGEVTGGLFKGTVSLQATPAPERGSSPTVRAFFTGASWSSAFRGAVGTWPGNTPYGNAVAGWSAGVQGEAWW